jgi:hypothetical protein
MYPAHFLDYGSYLLGVDMEQFAGLDGKKRDQR